MVIDHRESVKIVYLGGCWPVNIGNAFIDQGSIQSLKMACPNSTIHFTSAIPKYFFYSYGKNLSNAFDLVNAIKCDYLVVSGTFLCKESLGIFESVFSELIRKKSVKLIINGGGGETYTKDEVNSVRGFLKRNPVYAFISRDEPTFENYSDLTEHSHNGIDCAFFISDHFTPAKLDLPEFVVYCFDWYSTPLDYLKSATSFFLRKLRKNPSHTSNPTGINSKLIIRTHHSCLSIPNRYFDKSNTLISDISEDYLNLYANTKATFSNRVHACVATLAFNNPAKLFSNTPRAALFYRVGAYTIRDKLTYPNIQRISEEKLSHIKFLSKIIQPY